jgi:thiamine-phosphate pyrophosphorylase
MTQATALQATLAMVERHAALGLPSHTDAQASPASDAPRDVAYAAARRLGFIAADADCIAQAWQRQADRTGHFDLNAWPVEAADFGLSPEARSPGFAPAPHSLGVYAVLPTAEWVGRIARAGLRTVQLRFKSADPKAVALEIRAAIEAVAGTGAHLYINDHWKAAIEAGAYGVHLGQEDLDRLSAHDLQRLRQSGLRLGLSTHGYAEMLRAEAVNPSYVALGAVFPTTLKAMPTPPQGLGRLGVYARLLRHRPLVAIGGITPEHLPAIAQTGVGSFAVVRAITGANEPESAVAALVQAWENAQPGDWKRR